MSRAVLSIGSNIGDRLARLQSVVDGLGEAVRTVSPVYETEPWGGVEQDRFLNAVILADDPDLDAYGWLRLGQRLERLNQRIREQRWGPRTLDVDLIRCTDGEGAEVRCADPDLTLPHPRARCRAFVLAPWLAADPAATLSVDGGVRPVRELLAELDPIEREGVRVTALTLVVGGAGS